MKRIANFFVACWQLYARAFSFVASSALSNRGMTLALFAACTIFITGPWLRSSVSRDFRGVHIPWNNLASSRFLPEFVAEAPREWRVDSVAVPLLAIVVVGLPLALARPRWAGHVFGMLLLVSIPAVAVTLWNHPGIYEFFESEIRGRSMLRTVYRMEHDDLMTVRAPDRLQAFGGQRGRQDLLEPDHPMLEPLKYWMYGPWLVGAALVGVLSIRRASWRERAKPALAWSAAGIVLAAAATWPRWVAEFHWANALEHEQRNEFQQASDALDSACATMPSLRYTRRYWLMQGRLDYRSRRDSDYRTFFVAAQYVESGDVERARTELEPSVTNSSMSAPRDLLAEIIGHAAAGHTAAGKRGAAEEAWKEAAAIAPWKPTYWVAHAVTVLGTQPSRAPEIEQRYLGELCAVGDCFVGCDFASALGDAYFETGDFESARRLYAMAMDIFHLPKYVNLHAQEGRLGM
jgi:hypothetical protein